MGAAASGRASSCCSGFQPQRISRAGAAGSLPQQPLVPKMKPAPLPTEPVTESFHKVRRWHIPVVHNVVVQQAPKEEILAFAVVNRAQPVCRTADTAIPANGTLPSTSRFNHGAGANPPDLFC